MRIGESGRTAPYQFIKPGAAANGRQVSDVSREERQHLLTEKMQTGGMTVTAADTYSERAQLLAGGVSSRNSWLA